MKKHKIKRFNSKKGISLVLAIALSIVLFMTTSGFISIALMQQNETGAEMNTRQAYISAKSALDIAKELIIDNSITLPSSGNKYYAFYYDTNGEIKWITADSADEIINAMKNSTLEFIGNAYVEIKVDGTNCTLTAYGIEGKYTTGDYYDSQRELSLDFTAKEVIEKTTETVELEIKTPNYTVAPESGGDQFFMVGAQTNFSLMKSSYLDLWNQDAFFQTLKQYYSEEDQVVNITQLETASFPVKSRYPLVFTKPVKIDSQSERCAYEAYDTGILFLGDYSGHELNEYNNGEPQNVCFYTHNSFYGCTLKCKMLTIAHNMVAKTGMNGTLNVKYSGSDFTWNGTQGVVVRFVNDCTISRYNEDKKKIDSKTYSKGYYWLPTPSAEGTDLFNPNNGMIRISYNESDSRIKNIKDADIYSSLCDSNGKLKELHSAYESFYDNGVKPVSILYNNGTFQKSDSNYSTAERTTYYDGWDDYSIYCGPSKMPAGETYNQYYDMYCGDTFNYLWYNIYDMDVAKNVKMSIRAPKTVLSIGPDFGEATYECKNSSNSIISDSIPSGYTKDSGPYTRSNTINGASGAEFWIRPYWNDSSYSLSVKCDFKVNYSGESYTIKKGEYTDLPSGGINLLSDEAKSYFESHSVKNENSSTAGWTDSSGHITDNPSNQDGKCVNFTASSGSLKSDYKAKAIYCDFTGFNNPVESDGASLTANYVTINAPNGIKGDFYLNTTSGYDSGDTDCIVNGSSVGKGHVLAVKNDFTIYDNSGKKVIDVEKGYYYFNTNSSSINLASKNTWTDNTIYYSDVTNKKTSDGGKIKITTKTEIKFDEGRYS